MGEPLQAKPIAAADEQPPPDPDGSLRLLFMGTPPFAALSLDRLLAGPHRVVAVLTRPDRPSGRGRKLRQPAVKELALRHGIEVLQPTDPADAGVHSRLRDLRPDLGVVVAYGRILPASLFELPRLGCINAHASLLPHLRGAAPIERAIMEGRSESGVSIMRVNAGLDEGDVLLTEKVTLSGQTDGGELRATLADLSARLLERAVQRIANGTADWTPQDDSLASWAPALQNEDMRVDWSRDAVEIDRQVRAFHPRPGAFTTLGDRRLKVLSVEIMADARAATTDAAAGEPGRVLSWERGLLVACGRGALRLLRVQPEGKKPMDCDSWLRGLGPSSQPSQLGDES